jgi:hypothetical protein
VPKASLRTSVRKLAFYGQHAGFSIGEMIRMLKAGVSMETLILIITARLEGPKPKGNSKWVM